MGYSKKMLNYQRAYGLDAEDICYSALVALGFDKAEVAGIIYRPLKSNLKLVASKKEIARPEIPHLIEAIKESLTPPAPKQRKTKPSSFFDKDTIIEELSKQTQFAREGKERADIIMKIADVAQVKKQEDQEDERRVIYYLPLRCDVCPHKPKE